MYPFILGNREQVEKTFEKIDRLTFETFHPGEDSLAEKTHTPNKLTPERTKALLGILLGRAPLVDVDLEQILFYGPEEWVCLHKQDPALSKLLRDLVFGANRLASISHKIVKNTLQQNGGKS